MGWMVHTLPRGCMLVAQAVKQHLRESQRMREGMLQWLRVTHPPSSLAGISARMPQCQHVRG